VTLKYYEGVDRINGKGNGRATTTFNCIDLESQQKLHEGRTVYRELERRDRGLFQGSVSILVWRD
jgi:hypothetical protein